MSMDTKGSLKRIREDEANGATPGVTLRLRTHLGGRFPIGWSTQRRSDEDLRVTVPGDSPIHLCAEPTKTWETKAVIIWAGEDDIGAGARSTANKPVNLRRRYLRR